MPQENLWPGRALEKASSFPHTPQNAKLRLLLITMDERLSEQLHNIKPSEVELLMARRPGAAVRRFDQDVPDAVLLGLRKEAEQTALLIQALRDRPLGALVPLALIDTGQAPHHPLSTQNGASEAGADQFFQKGTPAISILQEVADLVGIPIHLPGVPPDLTDTAPAPTRKLRPSQEPPPEPSSADHHPPERSFQPADRSDSLLPKIPPTPSARLYDVPQEPSLPSFPSLSEPLYAPASPRSRQTRLSAEPDPVTHEVIRLKLRQVRHEDYFSILDVRKTAEIHHIEQAYQRLRRRFEPTRVSASLADRHHAELREICDALDDAFAVLSSSALRDPYLRALLQRNNPNP